MSDDPRSDWDLAKIIADDLAKPKPWWQSKAIIGAADSPVRSLVTATPGFLVNWAIESAVVRLRARS